jgi:hypothetical protein
MTAEIELQRLIWMQRNKKLADSMEDYCASYRAEKCAMCDMATKQRRNCRLYPSGRRYCDAMIRARTAKFRASIAAEMNLLVGIEQGSLSVPSKPKILA